MKLLFITQKIDEQDDDLAFVTQWIDQFIKNDFSVEVICLEKGSFDNRFPVHSLGKEFGAGRFRRLVRFLKYILTLKYDRVFVHMNPEYFTLGGWYWFIKRTPSYLWYTHYTTHIHLKLAAFYSRYMFAATKQSLPQYNNSPKKVVTNHGVDVDYWQAKNICTNPKKIVMVHRLSRSKRVELGIEALTFLPTDYSIDIFGRPIDEMYFNELKALVSKHGLEDRVNFKGAVPMPELRKVYPGHRIMINMAMETIDKTMLEAMCNGVFPITTPGNSEAIGLPFYPEQETPEAIADFIQTESVGKMTQADLVGIVENNHSLKKLVRKMSEYIRLD